MYSRDEWTLFRTLSTIGQKAGVPQHRLARLVVKELADNALDAGCRCRVGLLTGNGFYVEDDGPGIPGDDEHVAELFSIARPLLSSKLLRKPSRGAMGNGRRVVAGAVLATGGRLEVETGGRRLRLVPCDESGRTSVERLGGFGGPGTRVSVWLGQALPVTPDALRWAERAIALAGAPGGSSYKGKASAHWYDRDSFFGLLKAAGDRTVVDVVEEFDGCAQPKAGRIAKGYKNRRAASLGRDEAAALLGVMRMSSKPVQGGASAASASASAGSRRPTSGGAARFASAARPAG
jgi:hypothetical protein